MPTIPRVSAVWPDSRAGELTSLWDDYNKLQELRSERQDQRNAQSSQNKNLPTPRPYRSQSINHPSNRGPLRRMLYALVGQRNRSNAVHPLTDNVFVQKTTRAEKTDVQPFVTKDAEEVKALMGQTASDGLPTYEQTISGDLLPTYEQATAGSPPPYEKTLPDANSNGRTGLTKASRLRLDSNDKNPEATVKQTDTHPVVEADAPPIYQNPGNKRFAVMRFMNDWQSTRAPALQAAA